MQLFTLHTPADDNGYQSIHLAVATAPNHRKQQKKEKRKEKKERKEKKKEKKRKRNGIANVWNKNIVSDTGHWYISSQIGRLQKINSDRGRKVFFIEDFLCLGPWRYIWNFTS